MTKKEQLIKLQNDIVATRNKIQELETALREMETANNEIIIEATKTVESIKNNPDVYTNEEGDLVLHMSSFDSENVVECFEVLGLEIEDDFGTIIFKDDFNIDNWKKDFVSKYNLEYRLHDNIYKRNDVVINDDNNVNTVNWHKGALKGHDKFKFDGKTIIPLVTKQDCEKFEAVFKEYLKKFENWEE